MNLAGKLPCLSFDSGPDERQPRNRCYFRAWIFGQGVEVDVVDGGYDKVLYINFSLICKILVDVGNTHEGENTSSNAQDLVGRNRRWRRQVRE